MAYGDVHPVFHATEVRRLRDIIAKLEREKAGVRRVAALAYIFSEVHIGDGDDLGACARELRLLLDDHFPGLESDLDEIMGAKDKNA